MKNYHTTLSEAGVRPSVQRVAVYSYLCEHPVHPTVETLYASLSPEYPTLSKTTIYNTLKLFEEKNLVHSLKIEDDKLRYDADIRPHIHFKCEKCGKVFDVFDDTNIADYTLRISWAQFIHRVSILTYSVEVVSVSFNRCRNSASSLHLYGVHRSVTYLGECQCRHCHHGEVFGGSTYPCKWRHSCVSNLYRLRSYATVIVVDVGNVADGSSERCGGTSIEAVGDVGKVDVLIPKAYHQEIFEIVGVRLAGSFLLNVVDGDIREFLYGKR